MVIIMNATLAGGVAIGTCCDIITAPAGAMWVGFIAGTLSAVGFEKISPYLADKINLQDTCGVGSLHGMPGLMGGIAGVFAVYACAEEFNDDYFPAMVKGTKTDQVMAQVYMILFTFFFAGITGYSVGFFCRTGMFSQPDILFKDDDHIHDVVERYTES